MSNIDERLAQLLREQGFAANQIDIIRAVADDLRLERKLATDKTAVSKLASFILYLQGFVDDEGKTKLTDKEYDDLRSQAEQIAIQLIYGIGAGFFVALLCSNLPSDERRNDVLGEISDKAFGAVAGLYGALDEDEEGGIDWSKFYEDRRFEAVADLFFSDLIADDRELHYDIPALLILGIVEYETFEHVPSFLTGES